MTVQKKSSFSLIPSLCFFAFQIIRIAAFILGKIAIFRQILKYGPQYYPGNNGHGILRSQSRQRSPDKSPRIVRVGISISLVIFVKKKDIRCSCQYFQKIKALLFPAGKLPLDRSMSHGRVKKKLFQKFGCTDKSIFCRNILCHVFNARSITLWLLLLIMDPPGQNIQS